MLPWTDLGLRTLEAMVATGQQVSEQVDRMTRATAGEPTEELVEEVEEAAEPVAASALAVIGQMQAASFQWAMQAWQQWLNAFTTFNPLRLGAREDEAEPVVPSLFNATLSPLAGVTPPSASHTRAARATRASRSTRAGAMLEHADAESGKRRTSNRSKARSGNSRAGRSKSQ
jgi:hypothetical protein